jgi:polyphosphate kinase 2 (PPK2 family)
VLSALQLDQPLGKRAYARELEKWQGRLNLASRDPRFKSLSVVAVFEGNDGAGKGGASGASPGARRAPLQHVPVAAPTEEERAQPYLWRFWRHLPRRGRFAIFDRSWYGRVLVERVEGFCAEADWMRAYGEINDFEPRWCGTAWWWSSSGWRSARTSSPPLQGSARRTAFKRFKITDEDWRNREKWDAYEAAVCDMVDRTSTADAPWTLVEANNKYHARIKVLRRCARPGQQARRHRLEARRPAQQLEQPLALLARRDGVARAADRQHAVAAGRVGQAVGQVAGQVLVGNRLAGGEGAVAEHQEGLAPAHALDLARQRLEERRGPHDGPVQRRGHELGLEGQLGVLKDQPRLLHADGRQLQPLRHAGRQRRLQRMPVRPVVDGPGVGRCAVARCPMYPAATPSSTPTAPPSSWPAAARPSPTASWNDAATGWRTCCARRPAAAGPLLGLHGKPPALCRDCAWPASAPGCTTPASTPT